MNVRNLIKFLFPEYQIIETIREHGFIIRGKYSDDYSMYKSEKNSYSSVHKAGEKTINYSGMPKDEKIYSRYAPADDSSYKYRRESVINRDRMDEIFNRVKYAIAREIIGQRNFIENLVLAFKRPFVTGHNGLNPKNTIFVIGGRNSGRHTIIETAVKALYSEKILKNSNISRVDLSLYPTQSKGGLFLSDLYKGLYSDSDIVVFDSFEKCHDSFIEILKGLVVNGRYRLNARYALQNGYLVEATNILMKNSIDEISSNGKYFVFITDKNESKIADVFGERFMANVGDILNMDPYTSDEIREIADKFLREVKNMCSSNLSVAIRYDNSLVEHCAGKYSLKEGLEGVRDYIHEIIYKPLSEYKLKDNVPQYAKAYLFESNGKVMAEMQCGKDEELVDLSSLIPERHADRVEEIKKELESVIGLKKVKEYVLNLEGNLKIQKIRQSRGYKTSPISMNMIFIGNPGTGKTTIARIIAKYLKAIGVLSTGQLREVTRFDLVGQYVGHTAKLTNEVIQSALGGVLFIDEAYSLCRDKHDSFGLEAIDALVKGIEDNRDNLVVILAGYRDEMEEFLKSNPGLKSRFPNVIEFEDYTPEEMYEIALVIAKSKGYRISEECREPLIRLFERSQIKGRNDSGNGRLVRNVIESAILSQSKRLMKDFDSQMDLLIYEDFNFESLEKFDLEKSLEDIIGLEQVKDFVRTQYKLLIAQEKRRKAGINVDTTQSLNMIFTGNPGTGKTTIARVMASMFKDMGLLKRGHLVETDRGGLVAEYAGQTAKKTEEVFKSALGGVLFIDEAYALSGDGNSFGKEAIDTLVKLIEDYRGEIAVILAGYKKEMRDSLKANSGLESRFPIRIDFPDYSIEELYQIALKMIDSRGFKIREDARKVLYENIEVLHKTATAHSGNARMVRNLIENILRNQSARIASSDVDVEELNMILPCDISTGDGRTVDFNLDKALDSIIGLEEVKTFIRGLYARLRLQNERKKLGLPVDDSLTLHMIFKGNPGTGKTMVARIVADVLYNIGVIRTNKLIETDRAGLVAGYVGQTAIKTTEKVMEAMNGVLFIDEAYSLSQGGQNDYGKEAIDTLVKLMDDYRDRLVVILAGYSRDMEDFLRTNPGLKSRFPNIIEFRDYNIDELMEIAEKLYSEKGYILKDDARDKLRKILMEVSREENFGNGRYVRNLFERSINNQALRLSSDMDLTREELITIEGEDIERV